MSAPPETPPSPFPLGRFQVDLARRELFEHGVPVRLGPRAFGILEMLVEADGKLVTKHALLDRIWPDTYVEENTLQVHLSALRRALGDDRNCIMTVPGRGYRLVQRRRPPGGPGDASHTDASRAAAVANISRATAGRSCRHARAGISLETDAIGRICLALRSSSTVPVRSSTT
ncbi:winged helix-turn-helix transcriptional regulator [Burkholderia sp. Ac-20379]|nr:winged helix-turn-helix transcriptional regulator [Burkholderia sp. Ac-20379]